MKGDACHVMPVSPGAVGEKERERNFSSDLLSVHLNVCMDAATHGSV